MCAALCLCVLCGIAVAGASAAAALPIKFSTEGEVYQYAVSKKDPDTVTYGASSPLPPRVPAVPLCPAAV